jgi:hypothetical protein
MTHPNYTQRLAAFTALALGVATAIFLISATAHASDHTGNLSEEFHQTYPFSPQGRVAISNINGNVHITGWDRNEVKVDAVKTAWTQKRLDEAQIEVNATQDVITIKTQYPDHNHTFEYGNYGEHNNPASVEYTISVPRSANLDEIKLVNGRLDISSVSGEVRASCVNGRLEAQNLQGRVKLATVNGELNATVSELPSSEMKFSSVNGRVEVTLPSDAKAELEASTVSGNINDDFGLPVARHQYVGHSLHGQLGGGGTLVHVSSVNGLIEIRHANDNHPLSPAQNLEHDRSSSDKDNDKDDEI